MGRRTASASTPSEASELSLPELGRQIAEARAKLSYVTNGALRKDTEKRLRMLEAFRNEKEESSEPSLPPIIPTVTRWQVWKTTGYPIGAEAISRALSLVPQYEHLRLKFLELDTWSEGAGLPMRILRADYFLRKGSIFGPLARPKGWDIAVRAVPRTMKAPISKALIETGFPRLRHWLEGMAPLDGREGSASIEFSFDDEGVLLAREEQQLLPDRA